VIIRIGWNWLSWPKGVIVHSSAFERQVLISETVLQVQNPAPCFANLPKINKFPECKTNFPTYGKILAHVTLVRNYSKGKMVRVVNVTSRHEGMCKSGGTAPLAFNLATT
jgi:hypothetical protein